STGASWWRADAGMTALPGDGVRLTVLHPGSDAPVARDPALGIPSDPNDVSVVLLVEWGAAAILLTGDAYVPVEEAILSDLPPLTVLKVGHHGSRTSTSAALLERTRPQWALIPAGDGNRFGHPHPEVTDRLEAAGARILRSDRDGHVRLRIRRDGRVTVDTGF
ncbi:MAG: MBL fold metallo-hydrolase, partial [Gemmatimonadales bacterium]